MSKIIIQIFFSLILIIPFCSRIFPISENVSTNSDNFIMGGIVFFPIVVVWLGVLLIWFIIDFIIFLKNRKSILLEILIVGLNFLFWLSLISDGYIFAIIALTMILFIFIDYAHSE